MKTQQMHCADEPGFPLRTFTCDGSDSTCLHCGWMQESFGQGLQELVNLSTWSDESERVRYSRLAAEPGQPPQGI